MHLCRHSAINVTVRYAKIAKELGDSKTVRDVALRCRWMSVRFPFLWVPYEFQVFIESSIVIYTKNISLHLLLLGMKIWK